MNDYGSSRGATEPRNQKSLSSSIPVPPPCSILIGEDFRLRVWKPARLGDHVITKTMLVARSTSADVGNVRSTVDTRGSTDVDYPPVRSLDCHRRARRWGKDADRGFTTAKVRELIAPPFLCLLATLRCTEIWAVWLRKSAM